MSVLVPADNPHAIDEQTQLDPLHGDVEAYVLNKLDTTIHPSFGALQQIAQARSGRPVPTSFSSAPTPFTISGTLDKLSEDNAKDEDSPLDELYRDADEELRRFAKAMDDYEKSTEKKQKKGSRWSKNKHTWKEVLEEVDVASSRYNDPKGLWGKIRKGFRRGCDSAGPASAWLGLLPTQSEYFSVICGGLKLIIGAATRLNDLRTDIATALIEIPTLLSCTNRVLNVYKKSNELHQASADLFVATIGVMEHILSYYETKPTRKIFGAALRQDDYGRQLSEQLQILRTRSEQFERFAQTCSHEGVENIRTNVQALRADANRNNIEVHQHLNIARLESYEQSMCMKACIKQYVVDALQPFALFLKSNERLDPRTQSQRSPLLPLRKSRSAPTLRRIRNIAEKNCLAQLNYEATVIQSDVQRNLRFVHQLPKAAQDRIVAIIRHHKFKTWLVEFNSAILFLNGNYTSLAPMRQSPTSFISAKLASSMQSYNDPIKVPSLHPPIKTIAISFFCTEHLDRKDPYRGAIGILKSLTAQLLTGYHDFDTRVVSRLQKADLDDLETLCAGFKHLVRKTPRDIVLFCIVDAITVHEESEARRADVGLVLETLIDIVTCDDGRSCVFKLLVTCPRVSRNYSGKVGKSNSGSIVTMPEKVPSQGTFTIAKWNDYTYTSAD